MKNAFLALVVALFGVSSLSIADDQHPVGHPESHPAVGATSEAPAADAKPVEAAPKKKSKKAKKGKKEAPPVEAAPQQ